MARDMLCTQREGMDFKVQRLEHGEDRVVFSLSGRIQAEQTETLRELLEREGRRTALDLAEVVLVDRDAVRFLAHCQRAGIELRNCPAYVREWVRREEACGRTRWAADGAGGEARAGQMRRHSRENRKMTLRTLGESDLKITPLGIGAWAIGGGNWEFGWGSQDDRESVAAIHAGLDHGMNWIDTAAAYGLGHSETMVGQALQGLPTRPYVFTKCSLVWDESRKIVHNLRGASIRQEAEDSLKRLGVDRIDLYQIHWPAWHGRPESASPGSIEEAIGEMAKLKREGKIRHIGVSNFDVRQMRRALNVAPVVSLQPQYSLLARGVETEVFPFAMKNRIGVIAYSPMASGLLSGTMTRERIAAFPEDDWRKRSANFREPQLARNLRLVEILRAVGARHHATPGEVAIAWTLRNPAVTGAIVGVRSASQARGVAGAADIELSAEDVAEIEQGLAAAAG